VMNATLSPNDNAQCIAAEVADFILNLRDY
jgi:hypothetical protein